MTTGVPTATTANENDLKLTIVNPQNLYDPTPNGYSTAAIVPREGRVAYISGQGGQDSSGALSPDFAVQVEQAYANLRTALDALGAARAARDVHERVERTGLREERGERLHIRVRRQVGGERDRPGLVLELCEPVGPAGHGHDIPPAGAQRTRCRLSDP